MKALLLVVAAVPATLIASTQTYTSQASFQAVAGGLVSGNWNNTNGLVSYSDLGGWDGQTYSGTVTISPDGSSIESCVGGSFCPGPDGYAPRALFTLTFSRPIYALGGIWTTGFDGLTVDEIPIPDTIQLTASYYDPLNTFFGLVSSHPMTQATVYSYGVPDSDPAVSFTLSDLLISTVPASTPTPEPASWLMIGVGILALAVLKEPLLSSLVRGR